MENLKITIVQPDIIWEDINANLDKYLKMLENTRQTDVDYFTGNVYNRLFNGI